MAAARAFGTVEGQGLVEWVQPGSRGSLAFEGVRKELNWVLFIPARAKIGPGTQIYPDRGPATRRMERGRGKGNGKGKGAGGSEGQRGGGKARPEVAESVRDATEAGPGGGGGDVLLCRLFRGVDVRVM